MRQQVGRPVEAVILQTVHRIDRGGPEMAAMPQEQREKYAAEADKFLRVARGMADLTWTKEDRDWLNERSLEMLGRTKEVFMPQGPKTC